MSAAHQAFLTFLPVRPSPPCSDGNAFSLIGGADAEGVAIATGNPGLFGLFGGRATALSNANAMSQFGFANSNGVAISNGAYGLLAGGDANSFANSNANGGFGANADAVSIANGGSSLLSGGDANSDSNANANAFLGPANSNAVSIANGGNGLFAGGARANSNANSRTVIGEPPGPARRRLRTTSSGHAVHFLTALSHRAHHLALCLRNPYAGPASANAVSIATPGNGLFGSGTSSAGARSSASTMFGPAHSSSTAIATGK